MIFILLQKNKIKYLRVGIQSRTTIIIFVDNNFTMSYLVEKPNIVLNKLY